MSLLTSGIALENATGVVATNYAAAQEIVGFVPSLCEFMSINPDIQTAHMGYIKTIISHPTLTGKFFSMIRLVVSSNGDCDYCVDFNEAMLMNSFGISADEIKDIKVSPSLVKSLDEKEKALFLFVLKGVKDSHSTSAEDIQKLKNLGASEIEIYDSLNHGAHMVATDILINAFKIA